MPLLAALLVLGSLARQAVASGAQPCEPEAGEAWRRAAGAAQQVHREAAEARLLLEPARIAAAEARYRTLLLERAAVLSGSTPHALPQEAAVRTLLRLLLTERLPQVEDWFCQHAPMLPAGLDPDGELRFWGGMLLLERGRAEAAVPCFAGPVPPALRSYADWLWVRALAGLTPSEAGERALELILRKPRHRFAAELTLRAAEHLAESARSPLAARLLTRSLARDGASRALRAGAWTLLSGIYAEHGDRPRRDRAFLEAVAADGASPYAGVLRGRLAEEIVSSPNPLTDNLFQSCIEVLSIRGRATRALAAWSSHGAQLKGGERTEALRHLLAGLYRERRDQELLHLAATLGSGGAEPAARRAALYRARVWRRRGNVDSLASAYRAAARGTGGSGLGTDRALMSQALWELGRELEDRQLWAGASEAYGELARRFPAEEKAAEAALRAALCVWETGDRGRAHSRLAELCRTAAADKIAGPCLWHALLGAPEQAGADLVRASREENPGYFAFRASQALAGGAAAGEDAAQFWAQLRAEVRDSTGWGWPACSPRLPDGDAGRLLDLTEGQPGAERGRLFLALGEASWARSCWRELPGWRALSAAERAALLRALGDQEAAIRAGLQSSDRRDRYPLAYAPQIAQAARAEGFSPAFLLALMRQESLMAPGVRSPAGAVGLLQLMPATARRMADSLGWRDFELERPEENIRLGARHLRELFELADGEVPVALAGYNAGWERAEIWRARASDPDRFVERIGYAETRRFVKSVLMHYGFYRALYPGAAPQPD